VPDAPPDPSRRRFFRSFSQDAVQAAVHVVGAAGALQRGASVAAGELLGLTAATPPAATATAEAATRPAATPGFRSPYRVEGETVVVLDQVDFPERVVEHRCTTVDEVGDLIRTHRTRGAPLLAQLAGYGIWLAALAGRDSAAPARGAQLARAALVLRLAAPNVPAVANAVGQVVAAARADDPERDGQTVASDVRAAADALALALALDLRRLVEAGMAALEQPVGRPLEILTLDSTGPLAGGLVGTALGIVLALAAAEREVHVWLLETRPYRSGARLAAWELGLAGVPTTVVPDAAAGWLLARAELDAVLVGADRVAADGALTAVIGTYAVARLARDADVPLYVAAPLLTVDPATADERASAVDAAAYRGLGEPDMLPPNTPATLGARGPLQDVTPPDLVAGVVTEVGVIVPPFAGALTRALTQASTPTPAAAGGA
jgi:methylthioribose-1-phosphate isomerase